MQQWRMRVFIAVAMAVSLSPLALCLPLWKHLLRQKLSRGDGSFLLGAGAGYVSRLFRLCGSLSCCCSPTMGKLRVLEFAILVGHGSCTACIFAALFREGASAADGSAL